MKQTAFVFQDTRLFKESLLENIRAARPDASREEVLSAAHAAQCDDILEKLPQGLDTVVGARGVYLSGGEQQRIALARAILKDAPIVVLDEATAFADPENEHQIQKAFEALIRNKTVLMIAHRLSTVQDADHIIVLSGGKIAEQGSHESLLAQHGVLCRHVGRLSAQRPVESRADRSKKRKGGKGSMTKKLQHVFALSEKGAKDLVKAVIWCFVCNLSLMLPVGAVLFTAQHLLDVMETGGSPMEGFWIYTGSALAVLVLLFVLHWFQYASLYLATYKESASRRVSLAETLRRLPLSFFGNRDLSDLTSTMIADCSSLDQMFSHYVPQLFASVFSTLVIGVAMFVCDWRMALAILWVVPAAVLLTAGSRKIQDSFGTKNILNKRAVADCIQEGLETIRDIKACSRQDAYMEKLEKKLAAMEKGSIHSELATGVFVCSAQAFLRLGLATTILTGGALLAAGKLSFLYFLGFLFAAARLYDPLGLVLQNIAATFNAKLQIERMRSILEQPVQEGTEDFTPKNYDITFDHVSFAYREGDGVLEDVSFTAKQGEVTALIGPSGGGKSTACKLAARFWDVTGGKVLLGGTDVSTVDPETLLRSYSMVFQDVVLFRDTVMENIRLGRRGASDEEVIAAARAARCDEFIRELPQGYQTMIGENGSTLSGGERQRISIARALLKDAPVILLDEATASLDVENESAVQEALSRLLQDKTFWSSPTGCAPWRRRTRLLSSLRAG